MPTIISVITPSFNQGVFLGETIESVLSQQGDFFIDYIIIDGCSSDGSQQIIRSYELLLKESCETKDMFGLNFYLPSEKLSINRCKGVSYRWLSEKDDGHGHALNKGFIVSVGDILCWLNSDDVYLEGAFQIVNEVFNQFDHVKWITGINLIINKDGTRRGMTYLGRYNYKNIYSFLTNDYEWIQQEVTFWKRELWEKAGGRINTDYKLMVDGELWCRFFLHEDIFHVNRELACYRWHDTNRAHQNMDQVKDELKNAVEELDKHVSPHIKKITRNLRENGPIESMDYRNINFRIIDKKPNDSFWIIKEVDFFVYSSKRHQYKLRGLVRQEEHLNQTIRDLGLNLISTTMKEKTITQEGPMTARGDQKTQSSNDKLDNGELVNRLGESDFLLFKYQEMLLSANTRIISLESELGYFNNLIKNVEESYTFRIGKIIAWPAKKILQIISTLLSILGR